MVGVWMTLFLLFSPCLAQITEPLQAEALVNLFEEDRPPPVGNGSYDSITNHIKDSVEKGGGQYTTSLSHVTGTLNCSGYTGHTEAPGVHIVNLRWEEIGVYFTITAFVLIAGLCKLGFHQLHWVSSKVPESCLLIVLGLLMGLLIHFTSHETDPTKTCHHHVAFPTFSSEAFFLVLLPPIILESAYSLHDRAFVDNIGSVIIFAVFGTLLNIFIIGPSLYGLAISGAMGPINLTMSESLVFSSLISAVDPVAVLNIFQELGVNKGLYFLVFGESLFNDGVTVVVYNTVSVFMEMQDVQATQYVLAVVAFFVTSLCGALIGLLYGVITALVTRVTTSVRVVEPLALLGIAYLSYLTAEVFHFSGIISLIICGLVQAHYAFQNISHKSYTCVKYFTKMASATSETIIFMFLGMVLVKEDHVWHTGFILWTLLLCFVTRFIITFSLSAATNVFRLHAIGMSEQFILAYGGLRGAVAFSLVSMVPEDVPLRDLFVTTTLVVILFTVFVQGITIKPLVNWLKVSKRKSGPRMLFDEVHQSVLDHMMAGIEEILGTHGDFYLREQMRLYNEKYIKKWLLRPTCEAPLKRLFDKIAITEHYAHLYGPAVLLEHQRSISTQKLIGESPYSSKRNSVQAISEVAEMPLDAAHLVQSSYTPVSMDVQLRSGKTKETVIGVEQGGVRSSTPATTAEQDAKILRRAISNNPYNQLHYTYNRNLVNAENQELSDHLERRRLKARRLSRLASGTSLLHSSVGTPEPETPTTTTSLLPPFSAAMGGTIDLSSTSTGPILMRSASSARAPLPETAASRQRRQSGWRRSKAFRENTMTPLPGELTAAPSEEVVDGEVMEDLRVANYIISQHRRSALYRQSLRRSRTRSTTSDTISSVTAELPEPSPAEPSPSDPLLRRGQRPPYLPSFSSPADGSDQRR